LQEAQRAKELRAKFEEWEKSQDAKDQLAQMSAFDENGERLETAGLLRKKFEALKMYEEEKNKTPPPIKAQFRPKRFKVRIRDSLGFRCFVKHILNITVMNLRPL